MSLYCSGPACLADLSPSYSLLPPWRIPDRPQWCPVHCAVPHTAACSFSSHCLCAQRQSTWWAVCRSLRIQSVTSFIVASLEDSKPSGSSAMATKLLPPPCLDFVRKQDRSTLLQELGVFWERHDVHCCLPWGFLPVLGPLSWLLFSSLLYSLAMYDVGEINPLQECRFPIGYFWEYHDVHCLPGWFLSLPQCSLESGVLFHLFFQTMGCSIAHSGQNSPCVFLRFETVTSLLVASLEES